MWYLDLGFPLLLCIFALDGGSEERTFQLVWRIEKSTYPTAWMKNEARNCEFWFYFEDVVQFSFLLSLIV